MMASYNAAKHFNMQERLGSIAPGRVAHLNILESKENPNPVSVIAKGKWLKRDNQEVNNVPEINWKKYGIKPLELDWDLHDSDMQFSSPLGMRMENDVIMKAYAVMLDTNVNELKRSQDESFLMLVDRKGKWRVNTIIKGFAERLGGLVSSYSTTGDIILIGKNKKDMQLAFNRMKELGGGIVLADKGEIVFELPLTLAGMMYDGSVNHLIEKDKILKEQLKKYGYRYSNPSYNLLFLSSLHLPFIRITPEGIVDVKRKQILIPAIMR